MKEQFFQILSSAMHLLPAIFVGFACMVGLWSADKILLRRASSLSGDTRLLRQGLMLVLTAVAVILISLALPLSDPTRSSLLGVFGLIVSAVLAMSSTTFVANAMAGLMLRSVGSFSPGDFIRVGDSFGRVTERGLFHTEIQTEDRDLTTLPNLHLVSNAVTVVRSSGTIVSATVSLGYDVDRRLVETALVEAATTAELGEPFVQVQDLGDFSVSYRVAGFLADPRHILSARSRLRAAMLDSLHEADIEIVSPTFMNQRQIDPSEIVRPEASLVAARAPESALAEQAPEDRIFDKAQKAEQEEKLRVQLEERENGD